MHLPLQRTLGNGKYEIVAVLQEGQQGYSYLAKTKVKGTPVLIKEFFLREASSRNERGEITVRSEYLGIIEIHRKAFIKNAHRAISLRHPALVEAIELLNENNTYYLVCESIEGGETIGERLKLNGPINEARATQYIAQLTQVIIYLHENEYSHLSLNPDNILIINGKIKVYNLTTHPQQRFPTDISYYRSSLYTPYLSMEQQLPTPLRSFSPSTDIYAVGALFYLMLTNTPPRSAREIADLGLLPSPHIRNTLFQLICHSMRPSPSQRHDTIADFAAKLQQIAPVSRKSAQQPTRHTSHYPLQRGGKGRSISRWLQQHFALLTNKEAEPPRTPTPTAATPSLRPDDLFAAQPQDDSLTSAPTLHITPEPLSYHITPTSQRPTTPSPTTGARRKESLS